MCAPRARVGARGGGQDRRQHRSGSVVGTGFGINRVDAVMEEGGLSGAWQSGQIDGLSCMRDNGQDIHANLTPVSRYRRQIRRCDRGCGRTVHSLARVIPSRLNARSVLTECQILFRLQYMRFQCGLEFGECLG